MKLRLSPTIANDSASISNFPFLLTSHERGWSRMGWSFELLSLSPALSTYHLSIDQSIIYQSSISIYVSLLLSLYTVSAFRFLPLQDLSPQATPSKFYFHATGRQPALNSTPTHANSIPCSAHKGPSYFTSTHYFDFLLLY